MNLNFLGALLSLLGNSSRAQQAMQSAQSLPGMPGFGPPLTMGPSGMLGGTPVPVVPPGVPPGTYDSELLGHKYDPRTGFLYNPSTGDWGHDLVARPGDADNPWIRKMFPNYTPAPPDEKAGNFAKQWGKPIDWSRVR